VLENWGEQHRREHFRFFDQGAAAQSRHEARIQGGHGRRLGSRFFVQESGDPRRQARGPVLFSRLPAVPEEGPGRGWKRVFLQLLPGGGTTARVPSSAKMTGWFAEDVYDALKRFRRRHCALSERGRTNAPPPSGGNGSLGLRPGCGSRTLLGIRAEAMGAQAPLLANGVARYACVFSWHETHGRRSIAKALMRFRGRGSLISGQAPRKRLTTLDRDEGRDLAEAGPSLRLAGTKVDLHASICAVTAGLSATEKRRSLRSGKISRGHLSASGRQ